MTGNSIRAPRRLASGTVFAVAAALCLAACSPATRKELVPAEWPAWRKTTNVELNYPIPGHEDRYRVIRINDLGWDYAAGVGQGRMIFPDGTIVAKEIYSTGTPAAGEKPVMLTAMVKASGDPAARGGWLWVVKDLSTGSENVVTGAFCFTCHTNANEPHPYGNRNVDGRFCDFLFFPPPSGP